MHHYAFVVVILAMVRIEKASAMEVAISGILG